METASQSRVLVVDDDVAIRQLLATKLKISGFNVTSCGNGEELGIVSIF